MGDDLGLFLAMLISMGVVAAISVPIGIAAWLILVVLDLLVSIEPWAPPAPAPVLVIPAARRRGPAERCSYCHGYLLPSERGIACGDCRTELHAVCWAEIQRCPVLGCGGRAPRL